MVVVMEVVVLLVVVAGGVSGSRSDSDSEQSLTLYIIFGASDVQDRPGSRKNASKVERMIKRA